LSEEIHTKSSPTVQRSDSRFFAMQGSFVQILMLSLPIGYDEREHLSWMSSSRCATNGSEIMAFRAIDLGRTGCRSIWVDCG